MRKVDGVDFFFDGGDHRVHCEKSGGFLPAISREALRRFALPQ
jgi:hypothetical protein